jgi:hypothetical protein
MKGNWFRIYLNLSLFLFLLIFMGCSSNLSLIADKSINNDVRLPVDLIMVENDAEVLAIGPDSWFGHPRRDNLTIEEELIRLSFSGGEKMDYKLSLGSDVEQLVIFADFINQTEREKQQVVIPRSCLGFSRKVHIGKEGLELKE